MTTLKTGDKAPNFESTNEAGQMIKLSDFKGKKLVLFFYPKASTPGCTAEACDLRDHYHQFLSKGYEILGVSTDSPKKQLQFKEKYQLPFSLLADESKEIVKNYQVWGTKKFMGKTYDGIYRTTFIIDENGVIEKVITDVKTNDHSAQII